jgi:hypothetical protein
MAKDDTEKEERAKFSRRNLEDNYITGVAASIYGTPERYGTVLSQLYSNVISKAPGQEAYDQMILPELMSDEGALSKVRMQKQAARIVQESILTVKVEDALKYTGVNKGVVDKYKDMYVEDLEESEKLELVNSYLTSMTHGHAMAALGAQRKAIAGGLEEKFCKEDAPAQSPAPTPKSGSKKAKKK